MKRKILILCLIVSCLSICVAGTLSYYNAQGRAHNVITTGKVAIDLVEKMNIDGELVDFPEEGIRNVMPGTSVSKIASVKNTGTGDAWIRAKISVKIENTEERPLPAELEDGTRLVSISLLDGWVDGGDGFYYFETAVEPEELTGPLFDTVAFHPAMGNEYQHCTVYVNVEAQAVQSDNNPIPESGKYSEIPGWPTN